MNDENLMLFQLKTSKKLDLIINEINYSWYHFQILSISVLILSIEGIHLPLMSTMIIPLTQYFMLTPSEVSILSGSIFIAVGLGSLSIGFLVKSFNRKLLLNISMFLTTFFHLLLSLTYNYTLFFISRFIIGYFLGIMIPITMNVVCEILPIKNRAFTLTSLWTGVGMGTFFTYIIMLSVMPNYEIIYMKTVFLILWIPLLITNTLVLAFFHDSPRNYIINNSVNKGLLIFQRMNRSSLTKQQTNILIKDLHADNENELELKKIIERISFKLLLGKKYKRSTILLLFLWFIIGNLTFGPLLILSITLRDLEYSETNSGIILTQIMIGLFALLANILGGTLAEIESIGRRITLLISFSFSLLSSLAIFIFPRSFIFSIILIAFFMNIGNNLMTTYTSEIYDTTIRDLSSGLFFFFIRLGGFISQFVFLWLATINPLLPYYLMAFLLMVVCVLILFLPIETCGEPLDQEFTNNSLIEKMCS